MSGGFVLQLIESDSLSSFQSGIVLLLIGGGLFALYYYSRKRGAETETWPTTDGTVIRSKAIGSDPRISYEYEVDGTNYENHRVWVGSNDASMETAREMVESNQPGSTVTVYYDPDDPGSAVLHPGSPSQRWVAALAAVVVLAGIGFLVFG